MTNIVASIKNMFLQPTAFSAVKVTAHAPRPRPCVHAVRDLDAAAELYRRLGFTVGTRNRHAWGTHNRLVQLPGFFVELLAVAEPESLEATASRRCSAPSIGSFSRIRRGFRW